MQKLMKAIAAIMLTVAMVCAAGCTKPDDPTDPNNPNNGGNGGNGGGNGGGASLTEKGIYLGIIGFNYNLFPKEISLLDNTTMSSFTSFIDNLTTENLTGLYYADYTALKKLNQFGEPPMLTNIALVTFTDGLDNASLDDEERNPENYPTKEAYLNALHSKIKTEQIHGMKVNAYSIGLRGNDVLDVGAFQNNLKKLASDDSNAFEVTSMDEVLQHFEEIAESLHWTSVTTSLTLLVPPGYDDGTLLRFTFDQGNSAANSTLCLECTYKRGDNERRLENISYIGFEQGASVLSSVEKLPNGFYKFVFEQLEKKNGQGYITEDDRNRLKLYKRIPSGWEPETEFDNSNQSSIVNEQNSALIMLVLDCTTSLGNQFSTLKVGANRFVETLVNANNGGGGLTRFTISVSANPTEGGTVSGGGTFNSGALRTVTATANNGYSFTNWTENDIVVSTNANYTFTLNTNRTLVANFTATAPNQYNINVSANPTDGGTVSGGGAFDSGTSHTVTAIANNGYTFTNWTENGDVVSTNESYTFTVTGNRTLVAQFQAQSYTINVSANPSSGGMVGGGGIYNYGQTCTVTATANSNYTFTNWTENGNQVSTNANYSFTVTGNCSLMANFIAHTQTPTGAINGLFSVSATQQVWFSQGNLQYNAVQGSHLCADGTTQQGTWRFASNQYDYIGSSNCNISQTYNGWIDLFGWGTSGFHDPSDVYNVNYQPWAASSDTINELYNEYGYGPSINMQSPNLTGSSMNYDWGVYNQISNGGDQTGLWRVLSIEEWYYIVYTRNTSSGIRYAMAQVNGINGVILLPDNWVSSYYSLSNTNQNGGFSSNVIDTFSWINNLESHGAVFLPAAGCRWETVIYNLNYAGNYYTSDVNDYWSAESAKTFHFSNMNGVDADGYGFARYGATPVRLVINAN